MCRRSPTVPEPDRRAATAELFAAARRGELHAVIHELLPLSQAALAHHKMDAGDVFGRIVLARIRLIDLFPIKSIG